MGCELAVGWPVNGLSTALGEAPITELEHGIDDGRCCYVHYRLVQDLVLHVGDAIH